MGEYRYNWKLSLKPFCILNVFISLKSVRIVLKSFLDDCIFTLFRQNVQAIYMHTVYVYLCVYENTCLCGKYGIHHWISRSSGFYIWIA